MVLTWFVGTNPLSISTHEKINGHCELTMSSPWPWWSRLRGPMITAQSRLGEVTAQSWRVHSSVTARSRRGHSSITASSVWSRLSHAWVTAQSWPRSWLSHGWLWPFWTPWAHGELTVSSRWAVKVANFFLMGSHYLNQCLLTWVYEAIWCQ